MDIMQEHFKVKEYSKQLSLVHCEAESLKKNLKQLKTKLISEACILSSSLCLLLHIDKHDYYIAHLLEINSANNQMAIKSWVLKKLVESGYPYEACPLSDLATKLEIELNRLVN